VLWKAKRSALGVKTLRPCKSPIPYFSFQRWEARNTEQNRRLCFSKRGFSFGRTSVLYAVWSSFITKNIRKMFVPLFPQLKSYKAQTCTEILIRRAFSKRVRKPKAWRTDTKYDLRRIVAGLVSSLMFFDRYKHPTVESPTQTESSPNGHARPSTRRWSCSQQFRKSATGAKDLVANNGALWRGMVPEYYRTAQKPLPPK
jgi:hypothetical protein